MIYNFCPFQFFCQERFSCCSCPFFISYIFDSHGLAAQILAFIFGFGIICTLFFIIVIPHFKLLIDLFYSVIGFTIEEDSNSIQLNTSKKPTQSISEHSNNWKLIYSIWSTLWISGACTLLLVTLFYVLHPSLPSGIFILSITVGVTSLLWNRVHNLIAYLFQVLICSFFIWITLMLIATHYYNLSMIVSGSDVKTLDELSTIAEFQTHLPFWVTTVSALIIPIIQLSSNLLFSKLGLNSNDSRSLAFHWAKNREQNNRKYHNEYIKYD